ncbi:MAG TPA: class I adenylate-forming enzyme family protein [Candidatus Dormibacteraeota bacterium]|nr:class I adenylate-forming enzyme family protein [Candidatus Dormibacteraeota bacterium]
MTSRPTYEEALAALTAPDGMFAIVDGQARGVPVRIFRNAPATLRAFVEGARAKGDAEYLVYENERYAYAQVLERVDALAAALVERYGVGRGDRVAIAMRNYPEWIVAYFAATSIGAIAVGINAWWTTDELDYGLHDCGARVLLADRERLERARPLLADLGGLRVVAVRTDAADNLPPGVERWEEVLAAYAGATLPAGEVDPDDDAMILYTSGTTAHPKGVVSTNRAIMQSLFAFACRAIATATARPPKEPHPFPTCYILIVPLFHVTGLVPVMLGATLGGNKLVMMYKWSPERALELIERERVTTFVGVPTQSHDLLESPRFATTDTSSLQSVGGGGAAAPPELVRRIENSFTRGRPNIGYGMTETNAFGPGNTGDDYVRKPASTGRVVPICEIRVTDPATGNPMATGEVGEVRFRGPHLFRGYWNKPQETAEVLADDGWLHTGDLGYLDDEGFLFLVDRAKDIVIRAGENISCTEVENVVYAYPDTYECACFGLPHERLGEELAVAVYPKAGRPLDPDDLRRHVAAHLAAFKVPSQVVVCTEPLPRNASGKLLRRALRERVLADRAR